MYLEAQCDLETHAQFNHLFFSLLFFNKSIPLEPFSTPFICLAFLNQKKKIFF